MTTCMENAKRTEILLQDSELQNWGRTRAGPIGDTAFYFSDPYHGFNGPCGYNDDMNSTFVNQDAPVNDSIRQSHFEWVENRRAWSGTSKYLQEGVPIVTDFRGIRWPQPTPQSCNRAELTEYGPADYMYFVGSQMQRLYDVVEDPKEMAGYYRPSVPSAGQVDFSLYGF